MNSFESFLTQGLKAIEAAGLQRKLRTVESAQGPEILCDGRKVWNFSSNDYLGLASHPQLRLAAAQALEESGTGSGASRLICGNHREHERLEEALSRFKKSEAALSFSSGYAAALGVIPALAGEGDVVILDKLCHACLVDGARLSGAILRIFPHNNLEKLESHLQWVRAKHPKARILVLVESVYSMDGDCAPLREIVALKERYGAWLLVDEAHGVGVIGRHGRGLIDELDLLPQVEIQMGTLGKALGSSGAYICGSAFLRDYLINRARSFIFSTAPAPCNAAASRAAVSILDSPEGEELRNKLWKNIRTLGASMSFPTLESAILPMILGAEKAAMDGSARLLEEGFLVPAIRYPTVAKGAARLRVTVTAAHEQAVLRSLGKTLTAIQKD